MCLADAIDSASPDKPASRKQSCDMASEQTLHALVEQQSQQKMCRKAHALKEGNLCFDALKWKANDVQQFLHALL